MCSLCIASLRGNSPIELKVVDCPTGNDYKVSVTFFHHVSQVLHEVVL